jgi:hypothetical protein
MKTFSIDTDNNISVFASPEEAAAASTTPFDSFSSQKELAELAKAWPAERLVGTWNSLPGVVALKSLPDTKAAKDRWAKRIWKQIQSLADAAQPQPEPAKPAAAAKAKGAGKAKGGAKSAKNEPAKGKAGKKATPAKNAPKAKKAAKEPAKAAGKAKESGESKGARTGSKSEEVIAMLKRKGGATLAEIMAHTGWQKHTTRGWVSGYLGKKLGLAVESFKSDKGDRTYRLK